MIPIRCVACGETRPFDIIAVKKVDQGVKLGLGAGVMQANYQYCSDRPECAKKAAAFEGYLTERFPRAD